jgi:hypothetical protein
MTDIRRRSRDEIIASLCSGSPHKIRDALISACYWDKDWKWALQQLRKFAEHGDDLVLWAVATGVGFIAASTVKLTNMKRNPSSVGIRLCDQTPRALP